MKGYSAWRLFREGLRNQAGWRPAWRSPEPQASYDVIIVGAGGHGLATAYYLAKNHGITDVCVLEAGWLGGGNTGRNTTIIRSNYFYPPSAQFYDLSLKLYEGLSRELNYNIMFSQRGMMMLAHDRHGLELLRRSANAMQLNGVDAELLDEAEVRRRIPNLAPASTARYPLLGGLNQPRGGTARHDAVAWGYARAADAFGVDIVQLCPVTGIVREGGRAIAVETPKGTIRANKIALCVAGHTSVLADMAGFRLPITSYTLQAMVSEPVAPCLDTVLLSPATGTYLSQSDKGELVVGSELDLYPSYGQRGSLPAIEHGWAGMLEMFPNFARMRMLRHWGGTVDVVHDSSPIIDKAPVEGIYLNCGFGTGGFKAIPAGGFTLAHLMATGEPHPAIEAFTLKRFETGALVDEAGAAGIAH